MIHFWKNHIISFTIKKKHNYLPELKSDDKIKAKLENENAVSIKISCVEMATFTMVKYCFSLFCIFTMKQFLTSFVHNKIYQILIVIFSIILWFIFKHWNIFNIMRWNCILDSFHTYSISRLAHTKIFRHITIRPISIVDR